MGGIGEGGGGEGGGDGGGDGGVDGGVDGGAALRGGHGPADAHGSEHDDSATDEDELDEDAWSDHEYDEHHNDHRGAMIVRSERHGRSISRSVTVKIDRRAQRSQTQ